MAKPSPIAVPAPTGVKGWPSGVEPTSEFLAAHAYLQDGAGHLFVTGRAGTGKSTLLTCLKDLIADEMVVLAPDGARRGQRRRPDHPFLLRLPAAA